MWNCYIALEHDISLSGISLDNGIEKSNKMIKYIVEQRWHYHWRPWNWNLLLGASIAFGPCHVGPAHMHCLHDHADQDTVMHKRANILIVIEKISLLLINGLSSCGVSEFGHTRDRCCHFPQSQRPFCFFSHSCTVAFCYSTPWVQSYECFHSMKKEEDVECVTFWYVHWTT